MGEEESVRVLRLKASNSPKDIIDVTRWVLRVTKAVDLLHSNPRLAAVTAIVQARLLAVAIGVRDDLSDAESSQLLREWEKVSFRIYGMYRKDARTKVGDYVRLAWRCNNASLSASSLLQEITILGSDHPVDGAAEELRNKNCYEEWQTELRYFLFRYEENLARIHGQNFNNEQWGRIWEDSPARSIEHIVPQSKGSTSEWTTGIFVHRLGNLTLLPPGLNSKLKDKNPTDKAAEYIRTGMAITSEVAQAMPPWDKEAIINRENNLIAWAKQEWA